MPTLPQWVGTLTPRPADVWVLCLTSSMPPGGETPRGLSLARGLGPTSWTQIGTPIAPQLHRTSPPYSYLLPPFLRYSSAVPIFPAPSGGSVPPPANCCQWTIAFVQSNGTKRPTTAVSHTPRRPAPYFPPSPQPSTSFTSSPTRNGTSLKSGVPYLGPTVEQTCNTGGTGGGVDSTPPVLLYCPEVFGRKSVPRGFSVRTLSLSIPPQVTSIGQRYPK